MEKWIKYFLKCKIDIKIDTVILNNYHGQYEEVINTMILVAKQCIYAKKCIQETVNFGQILTKTAPSLFK